MSQRSSSQPGVLPLRPFTVGELLDAAVALLRTRLGLLIGLGVGLAAAEQAVLFPLRRLADLDLRYLPADDRWSMWTLMVVVGFAAEAFIIAVLGGVASVAAPRALLGQAAPRPERFGRPAVGVAVVALVVAGLAGVAVATMFAWPLTFFLLIPLTIPLWGWLYGTFGLSAPAVVIDRANPLVALGRSVRLAHRGFFRTIRIRLLAYLGWWLIRVAWGFGVLALILLFYTPPSTTMDNLLMAAVFLVVNALAYPMLAGLDVVLHLEVRMRTEGLDIALRRALARGVDPTPALAPKPAEA